MPQSQSIGRVKSSDKRCQGVCRCAWYVGVLGVLGMFGIFLVSVSKRRGEVGGRESDLLTASFFLFSLLLVAC